MPSVFPVLMHMHFRPAQGGLHYCVEDWGENERCGYETIAACNTVAMAKAAFLAAVAQYPEKVIILRQFARILMDSREPERWSNGG